MATSALLKLEGQQQGWIKGGVIQKGREGLIEVTSWSWGAERNFQGTTPTGSPTASEFHITKRRDQATPLLLNAFANNEQLERMAVRPLGSERPDGVETNTMRIELENARIASDRYGGVETGASNPRARPRGADLRLREDHRHLAERRHRRRPGLEQRDAIHLRRRPSRGRRRRPFATSSSPRTTAETTRVACSRSRRRPAAGRGVAAGRAQAGRRPRHAARGARLALPARRPARGAGAPPRRRSGAARRRRARPGRTAGALRRQVTVVPHDDVLIASDDPQGTIGANYVPEVARASATLASLTVRKPVERALDVGTGNGIQAVLAARHAGAVVATDVSERALAFAEFNCALNGADNVELRLGSFLEPVAGERFGLVVSNPPFAISPENDLVFRDSGLGRDRVSEELLAVAALGPRARRVRVDGRPAGSSRETTRRRVRASGSSGRGATAGCSTRRPSTPSRAR